MLQGTAISNKSLSQLLPGNVAVLKGSLPLKNSLEQLDQPFPAGPPLQGTSSSSASSLKYTRGQCRETGSLSTFSGNVEASATCISMGPAHCRERVQDSVWVSSASVEQGISHSGGPRAGSGNGKKSRYSFEEGGHRESQGSTVVTSLFRKKMGRCVLFLDLRLLNRSVMRLKFKMLTIKQVVSQIRSEDWFLKIDLKYAYFHMSILSQHRKFLRFAFRGKAYQYWVLPFGLALTPCTFNKCLDAALTPL